MAHLSMSSVNFGTQIFSSNQSLLFLFGIDFSTFILLCLLLSQFFFFLSGLKKGKVKIDMAKAVGESE